MSLRHAARTASVAALLLGAACSSNDLTAPIAGDMPQPTIEANNTAVGSPLNAPGGVFYTYTTNADRAEYWDNASIDGPQCNVGHFANNTFGTTGKFKCTDEVGNAILSDEFKNSEFLAGADRAKPVPFTMAGGRYRMKFLGGYRGYKVEPFGFAYDGKTKFAQLDTIVSKKTGSEATVTMSEFAFYITPLVRITSGDNCGTGGTGASKCSDDTNLQQFTLFKKPTGAAYLLGVEDKPAAAIGSYTFPWAGDDDRDYNDFFVRIEPVPATTILDGRMTGGISSSVNGTPVSVSLTIHCDVTLSNNLSVSWGNVRFQMTKQAITPLICGMDSPVTPQQPATNINTFAGTAIGTVGTTPATLQFRFVDAGETKTASPDQMQLTLTYGTTTLTMPNVLLATGGNIQTHYDQPHK